MKEESEIIEDDGMMSSTMEDSMIRTPWLDGGTSITFTAFRDGRRFFVKQLKDKYSDDERYRRLFRKEYELGASLNCQYIAKSARLVEEPHLQIWQEYVEGETLAERLEGNPSFFNDEHNLRRFVKQLLEGVRCLHSNQIVHLDLKPANIMLTKVESDVVIIDLGYCYRASFLTAVGGTTEFSAPEQRDNSGSYDARTDIYAIGKIIKYIGDHSSTPLRKPWLRIAEHCCEDEPEKRYQTIDKINLPAERNFLVRNKKIVIGLLVLLCMVAYATVYLLIPRPESVGYRFAYKRYSDPHESELWYEVINSDSALVKVICKEGNARYLDNRNVTIPDKVMHKGITYTVTEIGDTSFYGCKNLITIELPRTLRRIGNRAFQKDDSLVALHIPDSVTYIGHRFLRAARRIRYIHLPRQLTSIPEAAFFFDSLMVKIEVPENVTEINRDAFACCIGLKEVRLPKGLRKIGRGVFWECHRLETLTIPSKVTEFGDFVFWGCDHLTDIYMLNPVPPHITDIFHDIHPTIHVPAQSVEAYRSTMFWSDLKIVGIKQ